MGDVASRAAAARRHGDAIGVYADRLLDTDLPWTKMRQVYRLLGLVRRYGPGPVDTACQRALDLDVVNVTKIASILEKATENTPLPPRPAAPATPRFAPDPARYRPLRPRLRRPPARGRSTRPGRQKLAPPYFLDRAPPQEAPRREAKSASLRARAAGLNAGMRLDAWDESAAIRYDRQLWNELASLRFLDGPHGALTLAPVGVGKTHLAYTLGQIAVPRRRPLPIAPASQ